MAKIADMRSPATQLRDALEVLGLRWNDTREFWNDANSQSVEENFLKPLASELSTTMSAVERLAEVLARAQRECET